MTALLKVTPFHFRAAEFNRLNAWENRGGFTLASHYGFADEEAAAARFGAVLADISWYWRVEISGARAGDFVARFFTRNVSALGVGAAMEALWLNDAGAVRGAGTVLRRDRDRFLLLSTEEDRDWLEAAARLYGVQIRESDEGVLALIGPATQKILTAAGLDNDLLPLRAQRQNWRDIEVQVSRLGIGFEIACAPDDALLVWDRLIAAGRAYGLIPAGQAALDMLEFESGIMRPGRDYTPSRDGFSRQPSPQFLGLCPLVDRAHLFNGRAAFLAAGDDTSLSGVLFDAAALPANAPLTTEGRIAGRVVSARYLPVMQRAAGFTVLEGAAGALKFGDIACRPVGLPFLPLPAPLGATESKAPVVQ